MRQIAGLDELRESGMPWLDRALERPAWRQSIVFIEVDGEPLTGG